MRSFLTKRARELKPSGIRKYFDLAATLEDVISLGVGEPDFATPWNVRNAAIRSLQKGQVSYTSNRGLLKLRELIARYLFERFQIEVLPERTIVTVGASEGIDLALRATVEEGDEVLLPDPSYVSYAPLVALQGGVPVPVSCGAENGFIVTPKALEEAITPRTKVVILSYPNNPTGAVMTKDELNLLVPVFVKHDLLVITDEIYAELTYGGEHCSLLRFPQMRERTVFVGGFSKAFSMTGWRVGYVCAPEEIDAAMLKIHQYVALCAPRTGQHAALAALSEGFSDGFRSVENMRAEYDRRRRFLVGEFNRMGLTCFEPRGAFYAFPSVKSTGMDGDEFAEKLLSEARVAVVPGGAFGESGRFHVRCSYATGMEELTEAVRRIGCFLEKHSRTS